MPSNPVPNLSQKELKVLHKLLGMYARHIDGEQPLGAEIIKQIAKWVRDDIEGDVPHYRSPMPKGVIE